MALLRRTRPDASAWIATAGLAVASVGPLADLIPPGFSNNAKRIDGTSRHLTEIRSGIAASEQRTTGRIKRLEHIQTHLPDREPVG